MAKKSKLIIVFVIVIIAVLLAGVLYFNSGLSPVSDSDNTEITVDIAEGSSAYGILDSLDEAGLVKNKLCAKIYLKLFGPDNLQAYTYVLDKTMSFKDIIKVISEGDLKYVLTSRFTIVEGTTSKDAAVSISHTIGVDPEDILQKWSDRDFLEKLISDYWFLTDEIFADGILCPLEGYLYPDTYFLIAKNPTVEEVTRQILDNTEEKLNGIEGIKKQGSIHQLLTFSSIVECESMFEEDRPKIAGVFKNRLEQEMPLQSDITVLYALGEKRVDVRESDLKVDSKFNTYMYPGLPVGPVSNPSAAAIEDCINFEKNDYLYFFATEDGKVLYSKTYDEHLKTIDENGWY